MTNPTARSRARRRFEERLADQAVALSTSSMLSSIRMLDFLWLERIAHTSYVAASILSSRFLQPWQRGRPFGCIQSKPAAASSASAASAATARSFVPIQVSQYGAARQHLQVANVLSKSSCLPTAQHAEAAEPMSVPDLAGFIIVLIIVVTVDVLVVPWLVISAFQLC